MTEPGAGGRYVYDYPRPALTVDLVILAPGIPAGVPLDVLLIRRRYDPYAGRWALPGGFVNENEEPLHGAARELSEETGLSGLSLHELGVFGKPGRDPRGWTVSVAFWTLLTQKPPAKAGDDAGEARWFPVTGLPELAFDHAEILGRALRQAP